MLALIYLGNAIALGDFLCRRFYRFTSISHRWAAAILVGILLSTWFTYLAGMAFAHTAEPLLFADLLFFVAAPGAIFWLSRRAPKVSRIAPRAPGSSTWDWITLGVLFAAACVLLIGTLYVNNKGTLRLCARQTSDLAPELGIAQNVAGGHNFLTQFPPNVGEATQFLFFFQAGNLQFLGLNLAWSVNLLSMLALMSMLALVMALGEVLFISRLVGRLGATLFFFDGSLRHLINLVASLPGHEQTSGVWKQIGFATQRYLPFAIGILLIVLIFLVDRYRQGRSAAEIISDSDKALQESQRPSDWNPFKSAFASRFVASAEPALTPERSFVFSGLLLAALPLWNGALFIGALAVLCCLFLAYVFRWPARPKAVAILGRVLAGTATTCILASGIVNLWAVHSSFLLEISPRKEPLVKGLTYRNSVTYQIPNFAPPGLPPKGSAKLPVTAFEGGHGRGSGQFDSPQAIATDSAGNIYVADTGNNRVEKFSPNGTFITSIGGLEAPNGIAIDRAGNTYVAEIGSKHRIKILGPDGSFVAAWAPGFYGPRRIAIGPDNSFYVVDSGRTQIVKLSPDGQVLATWGTGGGNEGQFAGHTSVAVDWTTNKVYVADPINRRIQVFDPTGRFLTKWPVPEWGRPQGFEDLAIDPHRKCLYASSASMNWILVFDLQGNRIGTLGGVPPDKLEGPSGLALAKEKLFVLNGTSARVSLINLQNK